MIEKWLPVIGHAGVYSVSNLGRVRSETRTVHSTMRGRPVARVLREKMLKQTLLYGAAVVALNERGAVPVRLLVAQAFIPNPERATQVLNVDGNGANCRVDNLQWLTAPVLQRVRAETRARNVYNMHV